MATTDPVHEHGAQFPHDPRIGPALGVRWRYHRRADRRHRRVGLRVGRDGTPTNDSLGDAFSNGETVFGGGKWTIKPFGLVGHQNLSYSVEQQGPLVAHAGSDQHRQTVLAGAVSPARNPGPELTDILARFFPALLTPTQPANRTSSTWSITYGFDQYFWQPDGDPKHGIGIFFSFGASDGNPNPLKYAFSTGIGGKGVVPGRPDDSFGLGFSRTQFSSDFVPFLNQHLNLGLQHEDAFETYYNAALTQWLSATADLQVIIPASKDTQFVRARAHEYRHLRRGRPARSGAVLGRELTNIQRLKRKVR